jgi:hypothetical protein
MTNKSLWRCFHCNDVFTDRAAAAEHFGDNLQGDPACKLNAMEGGLLKLVRDQERELQVFRTEESASYRELYRLGADHAQALIREEEKGYAGGLRDANAEFSSLACRLSDYFHVNASPENDLAQGYIKELDAIILAGPARPRP